MRSDSSALHHWIGVGAKDGQRQKEKNSHHLWANTAKEWLVSLAPQINLGSWSVAYLSMKVHVDKALVDVSFKGEKEFSKRRTADHKSFVKNVVFLFILFPSTKERGGGKCRCRPLSHGHEVHCRLESGVLLRSADLLGSLYSTQSSAHILIHWHWSCGNCNKKDTRSETVSKAAGGAAAGQHFTSSMPFLCLFLQAGATEHSITCDLMVSK